MLHGSYYNTVNGLTGLYVNNWLNWIRDDQLASLHAGPSGRGEKRLKSCAAAERDGAGLCMRIR